jgi:hypothetical protein
MKNLSCVSKGCKIPEDFSHAILSITLASPGFDKGQTAKAGRGDDEARGYPLEG